MARVFLVFRDDGIRRDLREALEAAGHSVTEGPDAHAALARLRLVTRPSVVLVEYTDLWYDGNLWYDGAYFIDAVAADPLLAGRHAYLLATTDDARPIVVIHRVAHLPLAVLYMPFDTKTLLAGIERAAASITPAMAMWGAWRRKRHAQAGWSHIRDTRARAGTSKRSGGEASSVEQPHMLEWSGATGVRQEASLAGSEDVIAVPYVEGMSAGQVAASADAPDFTHNDEVLRMARDVSAVATDAYDFTQHEDYVVGWAHGYSTRAGELEGALEAWEDEGGARRDPWRDPPRRPSSGSHQASDTYHASGSHQGPSSAASKRAQPDSAAQSTEKETPDGVSSR